MAAISAEDFEAQAKDLAESDGRFAWVARPVSAAKRATTNAEQPG